MLDIPKKATRYWITKEKLFKKWGSLSFIRLFGVLGVDLLFSHTETYFSTLLPFFYHYRQ